MLVSARATQDDDYLLLEKPKAWARAIRRDVVAVWIAARDPRVPWYAKALALAVAAYALSPIDLIPDFIPVLGYKPKANSNRERRDAISWCLVRNRNHDPDAAWPHARRRRDARRLYQERGQSDRARGTRRRRRDGQDARLHRVSLHPDLARQR